MTVPPERCPVCRHAWSSHWYTRGCGTGECECRLDPPAPAPIQYRLDDGELAQLRVMVMLGHRAAAAAEALLATTPPAAVPDQRVYGEIRAGYLAMSDLLAWLTSLAERGFLPQPARRWTLGMPPAAVEHSSGRRPGGWSQSA